MTRRFDVLSLREFYKLNPGQYYCLVHEKGNIVLEKESGFVSDFEDEDWEYGIDDSVKRG